MSHPSPSHDIPLEQRCTQAMGGLLSIVAWSVMSKESMFEISISESLRRYWDIECRFLDPERTLPSVSRLDSLQQEAYSKALTRFRDSLGGVGRLFVVQNGRLSPDESRYGKSICSLFEERLVDSLLVEDAICAYIKTKAPLQWTSDTQLAKQKLDELKSAMDSLHDIVQSLEPTEHDTSSVTVSSNIDTWSLRANEDRGVPLRQLSNNSSETSPSLAGLSEREVHIRGSKPERRVQVSEMVPEKEFSGIARLLVKFPSGRNTTSVGTGCLISHDLIMTAAHNLFSNKHGEYADRVRVEFPRRGGALEDDVQYVGYDGESAAINSEYITCPLTDRFDCGFIRLSRPIDDAYIFKWMSAPCSNTALNIITIGYPNRDGICQMFESEGHTLTSVDPRFQKFTLQHTANTLGGCSGSPVIMRTNSETHVIAIHCSGDKKGQLNYACPIGVNGNNVEAFQRVLLGEHSSSSKLSRVTLLSEHGACDEKPEGWKRFVVEVGPESHKEEQPQRSATMLGARTLESTIFNSHHGSSCVSATMMV